MQRSWTIFIIFMLAGLGACAPARPAILVPTAENYETATPVPSPKPTETSTPTEAATPADAATATATETVHARPGTMVLSPEYNLGGQLEIIQENQSAFYDNFLDSLIRVNREYFQALTTGDDTAVTDVQSLRTYLKENDWAVPAGIRIPIMSPRFKDLYVELSEPLTEPLSLANLEFDFISFDQYQQAFDRGDAHEGIFFSPYAGPQIGYAIRLGFDVREVNGIHTLALLVVHRTEYNGVGFPREGERLTDSNVSALNDYVRFILYVMRAMQIQPQSELQKKLSSINRPNPYAPVPDTTTGISRISGTDDFFKDFKQYDPSDSAPEILRLR